MRRVLIFGAAILVGCGSEEGPGGGGAAGPAVYVGDYEAGLSVVGVSDPGSPQLLAQLDWTPDGAYDLAIEGDLLFVATKYNCDLKIVDVSNPADPKVLGQYDPHDLIYGVAVYNSLVFLATEDSGLILVDASDPSNPRELGRIVFDEYAGEVFAVGDRAFVSCGFRTDGFVAAVDASDPANPRELGRFSVEAPEQLFAVGDTVFVPSPYNGLEIIDFSDPANPRLLGSCPAQYPTIAWVSGSYAFINDSTGFSVIDVSDPTNPQKVAYVDCQWPLDELCVVGDRLYAVSDMTESLLIYDVSNPTEPAHLGTFVFTDSNWDNPIRVAAGG